METLPLGNGASARPLPHRPIDPAPPRTAPYETRAAWTELYVAWYLAHTPLISSLPADVDRMHAYEVEFNSCVLDPQEYERDTSEELQSRTLH